MTWKGWEDYAPDEISGGTVGTGEGEYPGGPEGAAKPRQQAANPGGGVPGAGGGGTRRPGAKGPARLTAHKIVYIDVERRQLLEGDLGKEAKKRRPGFVERLHSKREGLRYLFLLNEQDAGRISNLRRQVRFALNVRRPDGLEETIAHWTCDFQYYDRTAPGVGKVVEDPIGGEKLTLYSVLTVEDCKGFRTEMYQRSKKHFEAQYGIRIKET
jgi:hypothetical protein